MSITSLPHYTNKCNTPEHVTAHSGKDDGLEALHPRIAWGMAQWAHEIGMPAEDLADGLRKADALAKQRTLRCAVCFRWLKRGKHEMLPIVALHQRRFHLGVCCERCSRRYPGDEILDAVGPYLCGEGVSDE